MESSQEMDLIRVSMLSLPEPLLLFFAISDEIFILKGASVLNWADKYYGWDLFLKEILSTDLALCLAFLPSPNSLL